jgi:hypothetical protein
LFILVAKSVQAAKAAKAATAAPKAVLPKPIKCMLISYVVSKL